MKKTNKALLLVLCAILLVAGSVMGTLAYLTSTAKVENTFTAGKVEITLDEAKVDEYGVKVEGANRVATNEYKLVPGGKYTKDPTIHVADDSEDCWLFVEITKGDNFELVGLDGWTQIENTNVWYYKDAVEAGADVIVFEEFIYSTAAGENGVTPDEENLVIAAYAVQKETFGTALAAWEATFGA